MTITQLRPFHTPEQRARVYARPYAHETWPDHIERVEATTAVLDAYALSVGALSVADLSCGDGAILASSERPWEKIYTADLVPTIGMWRSGPIEETILELPHVDLFLCSETLEHVEDPTALLRQIRKRSEYMVLTTPDGETGNRNQEHYWGWDQEGVRELLTETGWVGQAETFRPAYPGSWYDFQMWTCS